MKTSQPAQPRESVGRRWAERPQQVWLRKALFQIHLWAGIIIGLYVVAIGTSGSILVFREELMPGPRVDVPAVNLRACTPDKLLAVVDRVNRAYPSHSALRAACPTESNPLYVISIQKKPERSVGAGEREGGQVKQLAVYAHPLTGEILGSADREGSWVTWIRHLHHNLLLGRIGGLLNGMGASLLLAMAMTGIVLWWPGVRAWTRALKVDFRKNWKHINWDLHSAMGFWTCGFTLIWALTGIYFIYPALFTLPVSKISPIVTGSYPAREMALLNERPPAPPAELDVGAVLRKAQKISPNGALQGYFSGTGPRAIFSVFMARGRMDDWANSDFIYFDQNSGQHLLTWKRGRNETFGDWLLWLMGPLHFGTSWGTVVKWIWCLLGLGPPLLAITGFLMYWNRWLGKRWKALTGTWAASVVANAGKPASQGTSRPNTAC